MRGRPLDNQELSRRFGQGVEKGWTRGYEGREKVFRREEKGWKRGGKGEEKEGRCAKAGKVRSSVEVVEEIDPAREARRGNFEVSDLRQRRFP